jgi:molybdopterin-binding protein
MNISARNKIAGKIGRIVTGAVNSEITILLPGGGQIVSVITKTSAKSLGLKRGSPVIAIIKACDVLVAVPCGNPDCRCK